MGLGYIKKILYQFEQRTHSENAYIFSKRATMAAGWWFYDILFKPDFGGGPNINSCCFDSILLR
jgi:hypothetical protein